MGRKVFVSVLGTGFYGKCKYGRPGFCSSETRFVQVATIENLVVDKVWTKEDKGYILLTSKARTDNWQVASAQRKDPRTSQVEDYVGLEAELAKADLPFEVLPVDIPDGKDEGEIWKIFDIMYEHLQEGDEIYFDITHGFRYLPMLVLVLGNYAKYLKNIRVAHVSYGNYEMRIANAGVAPFVDITSLAVLQDWTMAVSDYLRHGEAKGLGQCAMRELSPILAKTKGQDEEAAKMRNLSKALTAFSENILFCRGKEVLKGNGLAILKNTMETIDGSLLKPFGPLLERIRESVAKFSENNPENMLEAARLSLGFGNFQAATTLLEEGVTTLLCHRHGLEDDNEKIREVPTHAITKRWLEYEDKQSKYRPLNDMQLEQQVDGVLTDSLLTPAFVYAYKSLEELRNDFNHAGMRTKSSKVNKMSNILANAMDSIQKCVGECHAQSAEHIFINLSNHPSDEWGQKQIGAAMQLGNIVDMLFPEVPPMATSEEVGQMASVLVDKILDMAKDKLATVHVMGEMSLTYCVVNALRSHNIRCVCSTTDRIVIEETPNQKRVEFRFDGFRDYR